MLSIIIPTLNEEQYLSHLLESIKKQSFKDYEIIVADAGSEDKTLEIAKQYRCKIIAGGLPAKARNNGADVAKGNLLLFIDADVILPDDFFKKTLKEFRGRSLTIASFGLIPLPERLLSLFLINIFYNYPIILLEEFLPHAATGILIKKNAFVNLDGFDESIKLAEDHDLARRVKRVIKAKCGIIRSTRIFVSDRRFQTDGWFRTGLRYLLCELHMIFIGPVTTHIFRYQFNHYQKKISKRRPK